jgi:transposase
MLEALIAGERSRRLAQLALGKMRSKIGVLEEALAGHFRDHHGYLLRMMLDRIDGLTTGIVQLTSRIEELVAPFAEQAARLDEIPGGGPVGAQEIIAEIGVDMSRFPSPAHLVSWAKFAPTLRASAGKTTSSATGKGNPWIGGAVGEAAMGASRTKTFLGARYRRLVKRRGKKRALVAVGNSILTISYHLLADPHARFADLGADYHDRFQPERRTRQLIRELERLSGPKVTLEHGDPQAA